MMNEKIKKIAEKVKEPVLIGSYKKEDCIFLLKNISEKVKEMNQTEREKKIQNGTHYSETLPSETIPDKKYMDLFWEEMDETAETTAKYVAKVSEQILKEKGKNVVLVSLVRAGSPIGVLIKRYIKEKHQLDLHHYSISIIRGKGFDENALCYILDKHKTTNLQFIDGWTGKGAINKVLKDSCDDFYHKYDVKLSADLAVLADPSHCVRMYGTREDFLIPSACLNSTISGLTSRSVLSKELIGPYDFHGVKYYREWESIDVSNAFVDIISGYFKGVEVKREECVGKNEILNLGIKEVERIKKEFHIKDVNHVKPGVGETTRVLLRRVPWKILVKDSSDRRLKHVLKLAKEKNVPIEEYKNMSYSCCGIIKNVKEEE